jgi:hypothetical protein
VALPNGFAPSENRTVPEGAVEGGAPEDDTVAVKVTACPSVDGLALLETDNDVFAT